MSYADNYPAARGAVRALPPYVPGRRATHAAIAPLASNESHFEPLPSVVESIARLGTSINRYPDSAAVALRERIAFHVGVGPDEVAVGPGSVGVLQQIITSLCDADDEVIFAWRSFEAYPILVSLAGARPVSVPLRGEHHDLVAMAEAVTERTRVVLLCTPNNPTGVTIRHSELVRFLESVPSRVLVVIDEAYLEYCNDENAVDAMEAYARFGNVCVLRTFSKAHGLAGLRIGYAVARPEIAEALRRTALPFGVSNFAQAAAIASLDAPAELMARVQAVRGERDRLASALKNAGWEVPDSHANFIWLRLDDARRERMVAALDSADILVRGYDGDGVRITVADDAATDRVMAILCDASAYA